MKQNVGFSVIFRSDINEMLRARWYQLYVCTFAILIGVFYAFGLADSNVMGFTGLGRILLTFVQLIIIIVPVFALITTARTIVSDRELGVWEYLLSWPLDMKSYFWGKTLGRMTTMALPLVIAIGAAALVEAVIGISVPWGPVLWTAAFVVSLTVCFVGIALLISVAVPSQEVAIGLAFGLWIAVEALVDALLLGFLVKNQLPPEMVLSMALMNPIQAFRLASFVLFDPQLTILGPVSHTLLETFGRTALLNWALLWPLFLGMACAIVGARLFTKKDLLA
jgi:ABC-2 type transport system permease protein